MSNLPSNKLLSEVLDKEILDVEIKDNLIVWVALDSTGVINIYELAHKCKEWAYDNNYILNIMYRKNYKYGGLCKEPSLCIVDGYNMPTSKEFFEAPTEPVYEWQCLYSRGDQGYSITVPMTLEEMETHRITHGQTWILEPIEKSKKERT